MLCAAGLGEAPHPVAKPVVPEGHVHPNRPALASKLLGILAPDPEEQLAFRVRQRTDQGLAQRTVVRRERERHAGFGKPVAEAHEGEIGLLAVSPGDVGRST